MDIVSYEDRAELEGLREAWRRLSEQEAQPVPEFIELQRILTGDKIQFRILTAVEGDNIAAIACFLYWNTTKRYEISTRRLFDLSVKEVALLGSCVLGQPGKEVIRQFFQIILAESGFDLITVGEIFVPSPLYEAITSLGSGVVAWRVSKKNQFRWMIRLPASFDKYLSLLRPTTATRLARDRRRFERAAPEFRFFRRREEVDEFLRDAETVSRLTYQWKLTYGISNDARMREWLARLARHGGLRGYIAYLGGKPCAFGWGELTHRTFAFMQTGYDPQHRNLSPGTAMIMHIIRDLIENTDCLVFDFGAGGDAGYKSRLATLSLPSAHMKLAQSRRPYSLFIAGLDQSMNLAKGAIIALADVIIGHGSLKQRLRRVIRPLGIGTF